MVIDFFLRDNKYGKSLFFEETFILADISIDIALRISFFTLSDVKVNFINYKIN